MVVSSSRPSSRCCYCEQLAAPRGGTRAAVAAHHQLRRSSISSVAGSQQL